MKRKDRIVWETVAPIIAALLRRNGLTEVTMFEEDLDDCELFIDISVPGQTTFRLSR